MQFLTILAGANFRPAEARDFLKSLDRGFNALRLERDPENPYDSSAVKVIATETIADGDDQGDLVTVDVEHFIGFVARQDNYEIFQLLSVIDEAEGARETAENEGLIAEGHVPSVDRCEILDFAAGPLKPTIVIEISTGFELGTLVKGDTDSDGEDDFLPEGDDE